MFGIRSEFKYFECDHCGCLQIDKYPENISEYYPPGYYAFGDIDPKVFSFGNVWEETKTKVKLYNELVFGQMLKYLVKNPRIRYPFVLEYAKKANAKPWSRILDIGCGNGHFLCKLHQMGFSNLVGADKFVAKDHLLLNSIHIWKKEIHELKGEFDIITMHHVLEHMPSQLEVFKNLYKILEKKGSIIIRIPIKSEAWEIYKEDWVQLDAPRHYYIHTIESLKIVAEKAGFTIQNVDYDSSAFQFWGSEQYKLDIPLRGHEKSLGENVKSDLFTKSQYSDWAKESQRLNKAKKGDQAVIYLKKSNN